MRLPWILAASLFVAVPVGGVVAFDTLLGPVSESGQKELLAVKPGTGVSTVAHQLEAQGLVKSAQAFSLWLRLQGDDRALKAGIYALSPAMGARGIASVLVEGRGEADRVTVPEGFSLRQVAGLLEEHQAGSGDRFLQLAASPQAFREEFAWLGGLPAGASLEGFLFPDTYVVAPGAGFEKDLIRMMLARFEQVAVSAFDARSAAHRLDLFETVTLASIVEKEAIHPTERPTIAGVFFNRLKAHMPFGSDPTVEYVLQRHQGEKGLSFKDVAVESPYNTYKYAGLPPGPIANPGLASLEAVLAPEQTPYLYFVAKGDGTHAFTRTYQEHLATQRAILAARRR